MITWLTVWVLTATLESKVYAGTNKATYQLQFATREVCLKQVKNHEDARCDFQQVPVVTPKK